MNLNVWIFYYIKELNKNISSTVASNLSSGGEFIEKLIQNEPERNIEQNLAEKYSKEFKNKNEINKAQSDKKKLLDKAS